MKIHFCYVLQSFKLKEGEEERIVGYLLLEQAFVFLPLEHSEKLSDQSHSVQLYENLAVHCATPYRPFIENALDYARRHHGIIERFGRFPHRNTILKRSATEDEQRFLAGGGDTFGVGPKPTSEGPHNAQP